MTTTKHTGTHKAAPTAPPAATDKCEVVNPLHDELVGACRAAYAFLHANFTDHDLPQVLPALREVLAKVDAH